MSKSRTINITLWRRESPRSDTSTKMLWCVALLVILVATLDRAHAQEMVNEYQWRMGSEMDWPITPNFSLGIEPQMRLDENFSATRYQIDGGPRFSMFGFLSCRLNYCFILIPTDEGGLNDTHQYYGTLTAKRRFGQFVPTFRVMYQNSFDPDSVNEEFLRFRVKVNYTIPQTDITPAIGYEPFLQPGESGVFKTRYIAGCDIKVIDNRFINLEYRLDTYPNEDRLRHIFIAMYRFQF